MSNPLDWARIPKTEGAAKARGIAPKVQAQAARRADTVSAAPPQAEPPPARRDRAHAEALAGLWRGRYRWAEHRRAWMRWAGKRWEPATESQVAVAASSDLRAQYAELKDLAGNDETKQRLETLLQETCVFTRMLGALAFLRGMDGFHTDADAWDADPWLLNVANGTIDLHTGQLKRHDPENLCTKLAPVDYDPKAAGRAWTAHLERFLPDADVRRQVQRDLGLALIGAPMAEMLPIWYGTGANGKSTTARAIQGVMGDYAIQAAPNLLVTRRNEQHPTEIADLCGSRAVFSVEIGNGARLDEAKVKDLTGGDTKKARYMRGDFFQFQQTWNLFLLVNHKPTIAGTDNGIWRRVRLVPWAVTIPAAEQRPQEEVLKELLADGPAVLKWLLAGLADWQRDPHWLADSVSAATKDFRASQDQLGRFLADCCEEAPTYTASVGFVHAAYTWWCEAAGEEPLKKNALREALLEHGCASAKGTHGRRMWQGVRIQASTAQRMEQEAAGKAAKDARSLEGGAGGAPAGSPQNARPPFQKYPDDAPPAPPDTPEPPGGNGRGVSVSPWTDGPKRVAVDRGRIQELMDQGATRAEAAQVAAWEAEQDAGPPEEAPPC